MTSAVARRVRLTLASAAALLALSLGVPMQAQTPMSMPAAKPTIPSSSLSVTASGKTVTYTAEQLAAMPQRQVVVHNGHAKVDETYSGVGVDDLLAKAGFTLTGKGAQTVYHSYVRAEGTDHYFVVLSMSELELALQPGDSIIALTVDGKPLGDQGAFKLILAGEKRPSRWVRNLSGLKVVTIE